MMLRVASFFVVLGLAAAPATSLACIIFCDGASHNRAADPCAEHRSQQQPASAVVTAGADCDPALGTLPYLREGRLNETSQGTIDSGRIATFTGPDELTGTAPSVNPLHLLHPPGSTRTYLLVSALLI